MLLFTKRSTGTASRTFGKGLAYSFIFFSPQESKTVRNAVAPAVFFFRDEFSSEENENKSQRRHEYGKFIWV